MNDQFENVFFRDRKSLEMCLSEARLYFRLDPLNKHIYTMLAYIWSLKKPQLLLSHIINADCNSCVGCLSLDFPVSGLFHHWTQL